MTLAQIPEIGFFVQNSRIGVNNFMPCTVNNPIYEIKELDRLKLNQMNSDNGLMVVKPKNLNGIIIES